MPECVRASGRFGASPAEFDGEFSDKPGLMQIAPGDRRTLGYRLRIG